MIQKVKNTYEAYKEFLNIGTTKLKNSILNSLADKISQEKDFLIGENKKDLLKAETKNLTKALIDRLTLTEKRIEDIAFSCKEIAKLEDPVGKIRNMFVRPQGFSVGKMSVPIGVIAIIYEARPNVTIETFSLCLKSGNATILKGGTDANNSNLAFIKIIKEILREQKVNENTVNYIEDRQQIETLLEMKDHIHLVIPRGGENLIKMVSEKSKIPVLKHYKGVCHIFVEKTADLQMAQKIILNAKIQRPGVCNALETLLIDKAIAKEFVPVITKSLQENKVQIRACQDFMKFYDKDVILATEVDWYEEYLDLILSVKIVDDLNEAIFHINKYSSAHTEAILSNDFSAIQKFLKNVDSASVIVNASTRLADGGVYGLGAEIGIATDKLHARGPMGVEELTCEKWILLGERRY